MDETKSKSLRETAAHVRLNALKAVVSAGSGHIGGSLSITDILTALYFHQMKVDVKNPKWEGRDRLVLSKGHCSPALYGVLAEKGFFPKEELKDFRQIDSRLSGHVEISVPGVDMSTGSLGQGLSAAVGMALAAGMDKADYRVYAIMGDGEIEEGQIWEAAMSAGHYKLDNLVAIVDNNNLQIDGQITDVMSPYPIDKKFDSFNWNTIVIDGHDMDQIIDAFDQAEKTKGKPTAIIAKTVKGKGVSFMENVAGWHGKAPDQTQYEAAVSEIEAYLEEVRG